MKEMGKSFAFAPAKAILAHYALASIFMFFCCGLSVYGQIDREWQRGEGWGGLWGRAEE